jgi:predicted ATP-grasp superfamily ATP-dependent carboligase
MRLLVFEFITGGGFNNQPLPASLLQEGYLMRNALLDDLSSIADLELFVLQDVRLSQADLAAKGRWQTIIVAQQVALQTLLLARQSDYDAVWLIAPETDGILSAWCEFFSAQGKFLHTSGAVAVVKCQDKLETTKLLQQTSIACVPSSVYDDTTRYQGGNWVIKVNDSVGCEQVYLIQSIEDWHKVSASLISHKVYIIQPFISGRVLSLSCLFYQGKAYFICCNQQHIHTEQQQFVLSACTVNIQSNNNHRYQELCQKIASAMPQLFGYAGIDFIQTEAGEDLVLEINPRLTTSYAGIKQALGVNVAELVLNLPNNAPLLHKTRNQQVRVNIAQENSYAN